MRLECQSPYAHTNIFSPEQKIMGELWEVIVWEAEGITFSGTPNHTDDHDQLVTGPNLLDLGQ